MADVRALLQKERAARRINHPHATYSTTDTLVCLVCHIQFKSDSLWDPHLRSQQHGMRLQRIRDGTLGRPPGAPDPALTTNGSMNNKKRKASDDEGDEDDGRKKARQGAGNGRTIRSTRSTRSSRSPEKQPLPPVAEERGKEEEDELATEHQNPLNGTTSSKGTIATVDEEEWAAFEREVATPPPQPDSSAPAALMAAATISAAPMTAAEIAAKSREEASLQAKERREAELEGEKEDAALRLEEEFDLMEDLEDRVRRLKEKRDELRRRREEVGDGAGGVDGNTDTGNGEVASDGDDEESDEDEEEVDDWQGWGLR